MDSLEQISIVLSAGGGCAASASADKQSVQLPWQPSTRASVPPSQMYSMFFWTQFCEARHAESIAPLRDHVARDTKAVEKSKADKAEFSTALAAEKADLALSRRASQPRGVPDGKWKRCALVTSDHGVCVAALAEDLKVLQSELGGVGRQTYSLFQVTTHSGLRPTTDPE